MVDLLKRVNYSKAWNMHREPARPADLRILNFDDNYDYDTLWNDAIQIKSDTILLIGPPLYGTANWLHEQCYFCDNTGKKLPFQIFEMDRVCITEISVPTWCETIKLVSPNTIIIMSVVLPSSAFGGKKVIVTISKNHPISWLQQWIDYHKVVHNLDGLLLYNNQSSIYSSYQLEQALHRDDMTIVVVDYDVPFGVMGGGDWEWQGRTGTFLPWDSDFSQYVMLEHAKWRYLHCAKLAINADTDELLVIDNMSLDGLADYCETSTNSAWLYKGTWIEPVNSRTGEIAENINLDSRSFRDYWHTSYSNQRGIGVKWMLNPQRNMQYQWMLHRTTGPNMMTRDIGFGHYLAMNTSWSWKRDGYTGDRSKLVEHVQIKNNLEKWNR